MAQSKKMKKEYRNINSSIHDEWKLVFQKYDDKNQQRKRKEKTKKFTNNKILKRLINVISFREIFENKTRSDDPYVQERKRKQVASAW